MGAYSLVARGTGSIELSTVTRAELYSRAQQLGVPGRSRMNKEELARAVRQRGRQAVQVRQRRSRVWAAAPAAFRTLTWRSSRMIPPLAGVMVSAAIGASTPMLLVDSSRQLDDQMRADVPAAYAQPAFAQPRPLAEAASASVHDGAASLRRAAQTIVLADASGDSTMGSASQPADSGTGTPPRDSGPAPSQPEAGDGDDSGDEGGPPSATGSDDRREGDAEEGGNRKGVGNGNGKGVGNGNGKGVGNGNGKGKDGERGNGNNVVEDDH
jgi:hypothetical protein